MYEAAFLIKTFILFRSFDLEKLVNSLLGD